MPRLVVILAVTLTLLVGAGYAACYATARGET